MTDFGSLYQQYKIPSCPDARLPPREFADYDSECRVFNPAFLGITSNDPQACSFFNPTTQVTHPYFLLSHTKKRYIKFDTLIVYVHGQVEREGKFDALGSIGLSFGSSSLFSCSEQLPAELDQTTQAAELYSVIYALGYIREHIIGKIYGQPISRVYIVTESEHVVKGMSQHIINWRKDGFRNMEGKGVHVERDLFQNLDCLIKRLNEEDGVHVAFWWVEEGLNVEGRSWASKVSKNSLVKVLEVGSAAGDTI